MQWKAKTHPMSGSSVDGNALLMTGQKKIARLFQSDRNSNSNHLLKADVLHSRRSHRVPIQQVQVGFSHFSWLWAFHIWCLLCMSIWLNSLILGGEKELLSTNQSHLYFGFLPPLIFFFYFPIIKSEKRHYRYYIQQFHMSLASTSHKKRSVSVRINHVHGWTLNQRFQAQLRTQRKSFLLSSFSHTTSCDTATHTETKPIFWEMT